MDQQQAIVRVSPIDDQVAEKTSKLDFTFSAAGHRSAMASIELLDNEPPQFQNPKLAWDVNNDGVTSALDALLVINMLSSQGGSEVDPSSALAPGQFHDVNGDYRISALDALQVINALNRGTASEQARSVIAAVDQFHTDERDSVLDEPPQIDSMALTTQVARSGTLF